jgi:hypothetical protein
MDRLLLLLLGILRSACRSRADLMLENAALRHQLGALVRAGRRPRITAADRWLWVVLHRLWSRWAEVLVFVKPETVVRWHHAGFRRYWNWRSRHGRRGRPRTAAEVRALVPEIGDREPDRPRQTRPVGDAQVIALSRLGGLHHRYAWRAAA